MTQEKPLAIDLALALETSSSPPEVGSVTLGRRGSVLATRAFSQPGAHAADMFPAIDMMCRDHGVAPDALAAVYVSIGPGSFTGLRIGITAARMLALAVGARIVGIPSLDVIAQNASDAEDPPARVAVIRDAGRGRVYAASFERADGVYMAHAQAVESEPSAFLAAQDRGCAVLGDGTSKYVDVVAATGLAVLSEALFAPRSEAVFRLGELKAVRGEFCEPRDVIPTYVRRPDAEEKWQQRQER